IAISIYQRLKLAGIDRDEYIEKAYLQMQPDFPGLGVLISKDGTDEWMSVPLDTALQKAAQEGKKDLYYPIVMTTLDITKEFDKSWIDLRTRIEKEQILTRSDDEVQNDAETVVALRNRCLTVISDSKDVLNIAPTNALQEAYREDVSRQITLVTIAYDSISKYIKCISDINEKAWGEIKDELLACLDSCYSAFNDKILEYESLGDRFVEEEKNIAVKWEETINKEKTEWHEKLHKTLYSNWAPTGQKPTSGQNRQCFIATAVYGSPFAPEVEMLRQWRDQSLSKTRRGRSFISIYYKYSPRVASFIEHRPFSKWLIRKVLNRLVRKIIRVDSIIQMKN
ncbi:MAG: hypothetical protein HY889_07005, partial [Deltaproteobacteria bacterium]|nr:hypothetical protein [Deltaproteobacteria bacterium]